MAADINLKGGASLVDLEVAWQDRLKDADVLFAARCYASAIAAGLYALEIYLKVLICKKLEQTSLAKAFEFHNLDNLLILAGLDTRLNGAMMRGSKVKLHWDELRNYSGKINELRYLPAGQSSEKDARDVLTYLNDPVDGVLTWLRTQQ